MKTLTCDPGQSADRSMTSHDRVGEVSLRAATTLLNETISSQETMMAMLMTARFVREVVTLFVSRNLGVHSDDPQVALALQEMEERIKAEVEDQVVSGVIPMASASLSAGSTDSN